jgi:hypothetical protein
MYVPADTTQAVTYNSTGSTSARPVLDGASSRAARFTAPSARWSGASAAHLVTRAVGTCHERSGECIDLDLLELLYYTSADC